MAHVPLRTGAALSLVLSLLIGLSFATIPFQQGATAQDDDPLEASTLTVNVEFILDASGSMAEAIPGTDQSRMDAAKAAMHEVIDSLPERDGLNVGFRVYGHEGSNAEADRDLSCASTELRVPIDGVDRDLLLAEIEASTPTGWTPLALSLEAAAGDFEPGGESVTNAVIMVTDGEDTCGGDPCTVAGQLHDADIKLTTHVVGFALTPEQEQAVGCIAEEGGGQLFAADDASSLTDATLAALSEVESTPEPVEVETEVEVGGYVGGNAVSLLDEGEDGELSVVAVGVYDGSHLPIVVRNNTGEDLQEIEVSAIARSGGDLVATGADQGINPKVVKDGSVAFGDIYFGDKLPDDVEFEFELFASAATEDENTTRDLVVEEVNGADNGVIGILGNPHDVPVGDPTINAYIACFDETGHLLDVGFGPASKSLVEPGATTPIEFSVPSAGNALETDICPVFLVAGDGNVW